MKKMIKDKTIRDIMTLFEQKKKEEDYYERKKDNNF